MNMSRRPSDHGGQNTGPRHYHGNHRRGVHHPAGVRFWQKSSAFTASQKLVPNARPPRLPGVHPEPSRGADWLPVQLPRGSGNYRGQFNCADPAGRGAASLTGATAGVFVPPPVDAAGNDWRARLNHLPAGAAAASAGSHWLANTTFSDADFGRRDCWHPCFLSPLAITGLVVALFALLVAYNVETNCGGTQEN